ncbi:hypothetical protein G9A89_009848 [Geosiphon pyriformis]|nr:hypothetical protein G9A89_009848 [Geosiphon pyriformis]
MQPLYEKNDFTFSQALTAASFTNMKSLYQGSNTASSGKTVSRNKLNSLPDNSPNSQTIYTNHSLKRNSQVYEEDSPIKGGLTKASRYSHHESCPSYQSSPSISEPCIWHTEQFEISLDQDVPKRKPGRKLLTTIPSSKRQAQNRAAQRAYRERKEQRVKELESKIQELETSLSKSVEENTILKMKIEELQADHFLGKQTSEFDSNTHTKISSAHMTLDPTNIISHGTNSPHQILSPTENSFQLQSQPSFDFGSTAPTTPPFSVSSNESDEDDSLTFQALSYCVCGQLPIATSLSTSPKSPTMSFPDPASSPFLLNFLPTQFDPSSKTNAHASCVSGSLNRNTCRQEHSSIDSSLSTAQKFQDFITLSALQMPVPQAQNLQQLPTENQSNRLDTRKELESMLVKLEEVFFSL